jgi:hypothetical protein
LGVFPLARKRVPEYYLVLRRRFKRRSSAAELMFRGWISKPFLCSALEVPGASGRAVAWRTYPDGNLRSVGAVALLCPSLRGLYEAKLRGEGQKS